MLSSQISAVYFCKASKPFAVAQLIDKPKRCIREVCHNQTLQRDQENSIVLVYCSKVLLIAMQIHREILGILIGEHESQEPQMQIAYGVAL